MKTKKIIAAMVQCISNRTCLGCIYENDDNCRNAILEEAKNRLMDYVAEINGLKKNVEKMKKELAEPVRQGRWIPVGYDGYADGLPVYDEWECSECRFEVEGEGEPPLNYCPECGANMKGGSEE